MEEEYKISYNIFKEEKNKLLKEIQNFKGNADEKIKLIHNLSYYDEMLEKYNAKMIKGNIYLLYL